MDSKYGPLYTQQDLDELINIATAAATLGNVLDGSQVVAVFESEQGPLTFPKDEPLFLLRGKDSNAWETIVKYIELCESSDASDEHIRVAQHSAGKILAWQQIHPELVKVPG